MEFNEYAETVKRDGTVRGSVPWGELDPWRYSQHNLCPLCLQEGTQTVIGNASTLCKHHRAQVREQTRQQVLRVCQLAKSRRVDAVLDEFEMDALVDRALKEAT